MKNLKLFYYLFALLLFISACSQHTVLVNGNGKVPPGQMKKATGAQSAKSYAPGQQKKTTGSQSAKPYAPGQQNKNGNSSNGNSNSGKGRR